MRRKRGKALVNRTTLSIVFWSLADMLLLQEMEA